MATYKIERHFFFFARIFTSFFLQLLWPFLYTYIYIYIYIYICSFFFFCMCERFCTRSVLAIKDLNTRSVAAQTRRRACFLFWSGQREEKKKKKNRKPFVTRDKAEHLVIGSCSVIYFSRFFFSSAASFWLFFFFFFVCVCVYARSPNFTSTPVSALESKYLHRSYRLSFNGIKAHGRNKK